MRRITETQRKGFAVMGGVALIGLGLGIWFGWKVGVVTSAILFGVILIIGAVGV